MIKIGIDNTLIITRSTDFGLYLTDAEDNEVLLPNKYVTDDHKIGEEITVFVYKDHEERITATTLEPYLKLGEFGCLEAVTINNLGAFLDWGLQKHIFCPYKEQKGEMREGNRYVVYLYLDEDTQRLAVSTKIDRYLDNDEIDVKEGDEVELIIGEPTDLGVNVIVNNKYRGLIYENEIFKRLTLGQEIKGFIKKVREDNKLDIALQKQGYSNVEPNSQKILIELDKNDGLISLTDKSDPEDIYAALEMSKKTFKKAIGALYKQKLIIIKEDGIHLV
jgi:predicted RNA-binding protein (virulence factor B family)